MYLLHKIHVRIKLFSSSSENQLFKCMSYSFYCLHPEFVCVFFFLCLFVHSLPFSSSSFFTIFQTHWWSSCHFYDDDKVEFIKHFVHTSYHTIPYITALNKVIGFIPVSFFLLPSSRECWQCNKIATSMALWFFFTLPI